MKVVCSSCHIQMRINAHHSARICQVSIFAEETTFSQSAQADILLGKRNRRIAAGKRDQQHLQEMFRNATFLPPGAIGFELAVHDKAHKLGKCSPRLLMYLDHTKKCQRTGKVFRPTLSFMIVSTFSIRRAKCHWISSKAPKGANEGG